MIQEKNKYEFYKIYNKHHLTLKKRFCCKSDTRIEYFPGYGVRLSCMCGEGMVVLKRADLPDIKTEDEFVCYAVEQWNECKNSW